MIGRWPKRIAALEVVESGHPAARPSRPPHHHRQKSRSSAVCTRRHGGKVLERRSQLQRGRWHLICQL